MTGNIWDDPDLAVVDTYVKFEKVGDTVTGRILSIKVSRFTDGNAAPTLLLACDDGEERSLTAGAVRLKAELSEKRPQVGDRITVTLTGEENRGGGKTLRLWAVDVVPAERVASMERHPSAAPPPLAAVPNAAPVTSASGPPVTLSPEQVAALQAMGIQVPGA